MMATYDHLTGEQLRRACVTRGKPNWADLPATTIAELMRLDDLDRDDIERYWNDD